MRNDYKTIPWLNAHESNEIEIRLIEAKNSILREGMLDGTESELETQNKEDSEEREQASVESTVALPSPHAHETQREEDTEDPDQVSNVLVPKQDIETSRNDYHTIPRLSANGSNVIEMTLIEDDGKEEQANPSILFTFKNENKVDSEEREQSPEESNVALSPPQANTHQREEDTEEPEQISIVLISK